MRLNVIFKELDKKLNVTFKELDKKLNVKFQDFQIISDNTDVEHYIGSYSVTPKVTEQKLVTRRKYMSDDVTIKAIPFFEVSNVEGGATVYIGKEI